MIDQSIIERYLEGKASERDLQILKDALERGDTETLRKKMGADWYRLSSMSSDLGERSEEMWKSIEGSTKQPRISQRRKYVGWYSAAAVVLLLISVGWWMSNNQGATIEYRTAFADWKTIELPDGSSVNLNANSSIRFANDWESGEDRVVWLTGEAFFDVEKKLATGAKFQVVTDDLTVEVLGTAFNVNSRGEQTDVFLEEGAIRLQLPEGKEEFLKPGEFLAFSKKKNSILAREESVLTENYVSWKDGVLVLKNQPADKILSRVEDIYGVSIKIDGLQIVGTKTISIPMDKLEIAIPLLEGCFDAQIIKQDDQLLFMEKIGPE